MPTPDDSSLSAASHYKATEYGNDDPYDMKVPAAQVYMSIQKRYSMKNQERMEKPHSVDRVKVPLPRDLDPRVHIELKNKLTGEVGFQLVRAGNTRRKRLEFLAREIEGRPEMPFPRLTYVDRAMFPGEEKDYCRPQLPMPNLKTRSKILLVDILANVILKQTDWIKFLSTDEYVHLWDDPHPVWVEWTKTPMPDPIWVVSIRKTLPDRFGKAHYIPELELRFD
ncbi:hypothetical protein GSI_09379 [Ganoderma sinense ZZ0214-1]|uniref:Uncharacterized protein n=1 Tax=Ganoderma sinense ZZ0214-1 TaxID=1077348 RepID=A0A2G8S701_9APHY|nr:hypothetical protein GSI_09379 [Ganoderma sinense ZZ0214-1]